MIFDPQSLLDGANQRDNQMQPIYGLNYEIFEIDHLRVFIPTSWVCLSFYDRPDDDTLYLLKKSSFCYGWFDPAKQSCWYAVATSLTRGMAADIARGATFQPDPWIEESF